MHTSISKWGNSLAVRIPKGMLEQAGLKAGDGVELDVGEDGSLVLRPAQGRYDLDRLVAGITPENSPEEIDWGSPEGKEVW